MTKQSLVIVKTYRGSKSAVSKAFQADANKLAAQGYLPTSQSWAPKRYGCFSILLALLLCFALIGFFIIIYMIVGAPGVLSVTYTLRPSGEAVAVPGDEKTCPNCAERVKVAAAACRFCGHRFTI